MTDVKNDIGFFANCLLKLNSSKQLSVADITRLNQYVKESNMEQLKDEPFPAHTMNPDNFPGLFDKKKT